MRASAADRIRWMAIVSVALAMSVTAGCLWAGGARAAFGVKSFDVQIAAKAPAAGDEADLAASGGSFRQAAGHPYSVVTHIEWNNHPLISNDQTYAGNPTPDADIKNTDVDLPAGLVGNPGAVPRCTSQQLSGKVVAIVNNYSECPSDSQVGIVRVRLTNGEFIKPLFNMVSPIGLAGRFGFNIAKTLVFFDASLNAKREYRITVGSHETLQAVRAYAADVTFWGVPAAAGHDGERCNSNSSMDGTASRAICTGTANEGPSHLFSPHAAGVAPTAFLTMPTSCPAPGVGEHWDLRTDSWSEPGIFSEARVTNHMAPYAPDVSAPGNEAGMEGCFRVPFDPDLTIQPSQKRAGSSTGLAVQLTVPSDGLLNPAGIAQSHLKKAVVTLPEGVTINPSSAEGLGICTPAQYEQASVDEPGCPSTAKVGTVAIRTPVLDEQLAGEVFVAQSDDPRTTTDGAENPFDSLLAIYLVIRNHDRGVLVKLAGKVEPDPETGQLVTTFEDLPQQPFESFEFHFREGPRAPLITPRTCGTYTTVGEFTPWSDPGDVATTYSTFEIDHGPNGGPCPSAGVPPFNPGFSAGTLNNNAGSYSPFLMRLTRQDSEQDMTKFSAILPPGVAAKIAGVSKCSNAALAVAAEKTGTEERESPSCPPNSKIGSILAGAGVGSTLVYVPGRLYLAGPYNGAPLSAVAITPAVAGPFDVGTVIVREALTLDPKTAEVRVDGDRSDPIPHILAGIPLAVRDLRVSVDRPDFTINPTSCDPSQVGATLFGSFLDVLSPHDDVPVGLSSRFQAASCLNLGFKPRLSLKLTGASKRGGFPGLRAELKPRPGDANLEQAVVTLPKSAFLEQGHIRTICTRVQFAAKSCPPASIYGHVRAWTPLLDQPLEGPVYLRSSSHKLPDLVLALKGIVEIEAVGRIDSIGGRIRSSFEDIPDAPISKVILTMQGAKKGLIVNSRNLCRARGKAKAQLDGQNGKAHDFKPTVKSSCRKSRRHAAKRPDRKPKQR